MYRVLILFSAFLLAIAGMLFLQDGQNRKPPELARGAAELDLRGATTLSAPANSAVRSGLPDEFPAVVPPAPAEGSMADLTAGVLAGLGAATPPASAAPAPGDEQMATLTANVLAGLGGGPTPALAQPLPAQDLQGLVAQAIREGQSDTYIDILLNEAAVAGRVVVPGALMTAEGKVDTATLLASIVRQAAAETDAFTSALIAEANAATSLPRPATAPGSDTRFYVVEPGDSLAYIAMVFYGSPAGFARIFEANRDKIESPDKIRVGQKLLIPR